VRVDPRLPENPVGEWDEYFTDALAKPLHPLYRVLDPLLPKGGRAAELGCGVGHGVLHLLERGFTVDALDAHPLALKTLEGRLSAEQTDRCRLLPLMLQDWYPEAASYDVVVAGFTLFFVPASDLPAVWERIVTSLKPGGLFMGQFLGVRDDWAAQGYSAQSRQEVESLLAGFQIRHLEEVERDGETVQGSAKHWHVFHVVAGRGEARLARSAR